MKAKDLWCNILLRLISINVVVFIGVHLAVLLGVSQYAVSEHVALPANPVLGVTHVYTAVTYMFTQWQFTHLLFNMLWLWCFGSILLRYGQRARVVVTAYMAGGLAGAACFMILGTLHLASGVLIGSSAAILAVMATCGVVLSRRRVELMLFGAVEVRWLAVAVIAFTVVVDATAGGLVQIGPHMAGAVAGLVYGIKLMRSSDEAPVRQRGLNAKEHAELDRLLAKVKNSGYDALSSADRTRLFQLTNKLK